MKYWVLLGIVLASLLLSVGVGYAYVAVCDSTNHFGSDYCAIEIMGDISSSDIQIEVKEFTVESSTIPFLGFSFNEADFQETLSLHYFNTIGTDVILSIGFSCKTESGDPIIKCILNGTTVGSTSLVGDGTKTGTISGIVLPVGVDDGGRADLKFQVENIDLNTPVQMSFSVHPLEASS